jgi:hypothetical protein
MKYIAVGCALALVALLYAHVTAQYFTVCPLQKSKLVAMAKRGAKKKEFMAAMSVCSNGQMGRVNGLSQETRTYLQETDNEELKSAIKGYKGFKGSIAISNSIRNTEPIGFIFLSLASVAVLSVGSCSQRVASLSLIMIVLLHLMLMPIPFGCKGLIPCKDMGIDDTDLWQPFVGGYCCEPVLDKRLKDAHLNMITIITVFAMVVTYVCVSTVMKDTKNKPWQYASYAVVVIQLGAFAGFHLFPKTKPEDAKDVPDSFLPGWIISEHLVAYSMYVLPMIALW